MAKETDFGEFEFLRRLTETPGVSGREERVRELVLKESADLWDETSVDDLGNLICFKKTTRKVGRGPAKKVMLSCHMDEIGFYVRHIDDAGRLRLQAVGGFDTRNLFARNVLVQGKKDLIGVLNPVGKPIHMLTPEERNKIPQISDFYVDLMLPKKRVEDLVSIGDPVTLIQKTRMLGKYIVGKCMDDRISLWVAVTALRKMFGNGKRGAKGEDVGSPYDIYMVGTTQEEVGLRGATTAAYTINPDIGIAIDVTTGTNGLETSKGDMLIELGKGPSLTLMDGRTIGHVGLIDELADVAKKYRIKHQPRVSGAGGTDAGALQKARGGVKTFTLSMPCRNLHTVTEIVHQDDLVSASDLLAAWLRGG